MCVIDIISYRFPDGHRESEEEKSLCSKSDGINPCRDHVRQRRPERIIRPSVNYSTPSSRPATHLRVPSLTPDQSPSPATSVAPSTPGLATAGPPPFSYLAPKKDPNRRVSFGLDNLSINTDAKREEPSSTSSSSRKRASPERERKSSSTKRGSRSHCHSRSRNEDDDIVAVEEDGVMKPLPSMRRARPAEPASTPGEQNIPKRWSQSEASVPDSPPFGRAPRLQDPPGFLNDRPTFTHGAVDGTLFDSDTEHNGTSVRHETQSRGDDSRRQLRARREQEENDRLLATRLQAEEEAKEIAEDNYSTLEYNRIEGREQIRAMARQRREQEEAERLREEQDMERLLDDIRRAKSRTEKQREAAAAAEEAVRQKQLERAARQREVDARAELDRLRHEEQDREQRRALLERAEAERLDCETEAEVRRILAEDSRQREQERQLKREASSARRDAELREARRAMLRDEVARAQRLADDIARLEARNQREEAIALNEAEQRRLHDQLARSRPRYDSDWDYDTSDIDSLRSNASRRAIAAAYSSSRGSPATPPLSPLGQGRLAGLPSRDRHSDAEARRRRGERILNDLENSGRARDAHDEMYRALHGDEYASPTSP